MKILAIDLGGRSAKCGIFTKQGVLLKKFVVKTVIGRVLENLHEKTNSYFQEHDLNWSEIIGIGISTAGFFDNKTGIVTLSGNLEWKDYPLQSNASKLWNKPVFIINDANAAAYGEYWKGVANKYHSLIFYTLGTGVGGGIILNDQLITGFQGYGGELGHGGRLQHHVLCTCGQQYCIEPMSSATGIEKIVNEYALNNPESSIGKLRFLLKKVLEVKDLKNLLQQEDEITIKLFLEALRPLADHMSIMIYALNPQAIIIGGGVSKLGTILIKLVNTLLQETTAQFILKDTVIATSTLQNDAGMYGACYFAGQHF